MDTFKPKVGFCVVDHPLEVGADKSGYIIKKTQEEFMHYDLDFVIYPEVVDDNQDIVKVGKYFYQENIDLLLIIQATWSNDYHVTDLLEYVDVPVCLWAIPGMEN